MDTISQEAETLLSDAGDYLDARTKLWKLRTIEHAAEIYSSLISRLVFVAIYSIVALFAMIGAALWIGEKLGRVWLGFFVIGGIFLVAGLLIYAFRRSWLDIPTSNAFIKKLIK